MNTIVQYNTIIIVYTLNVYKIITQTLNLVKFLVFILVDLIDSNFNYYLVYCMWLYDFKYQCVNTHFRPLGSYAKI